MRKVYILSLLCCLVSNAWADDVGALLKSVSLGKTEAELLSAVDCEPYTKGTHWSYECGLPSSLSVNKNSGIMILMIPNPYIGLSRDQNRLSLEHLQRKVERGEKVDGKVVDAAIAKYEKREKEIDRRASQLVVGKLRFIYPPFTPENAESYKTQFLEANGIEHPVSSVFYATDRKIGKDYKYTFQTYKQTEYYNLFSAEKRFDEDQMYLEGDNANRAWVDFRQDGSVEILDVTHSSLFDRDDGSYKDPMDVKKGWLGNLKSWLFK